MRTKAMADTLTNMKVVGYKWSIQTDVDHLVELHQELDNLDGSVEIRFVAEVDEYGCVREWGFYDESRHIPRLENQSPRMADGSPITEVLK